MARLLERRLAALSWPPVDLSDRVAAVSNQGPRPLCVAFALGSAHESAAHRDAADGGGHGDGADPDGDGADRDGVDPDRGGHGTDPDLHRDDQGDDGEDNLGAADQFVPAPEPLWWWMCKHGLAGPQGALLADGGAALAAVGQCQVRDWPYDDSLGHGTQDPPPAAGPAPWRRGTLVPVSVAHDGVEEELEAELAGGSPVVMVIEVTDEFELPDEDGFVDAPDLRAPSGGYHAVVVEGAWTEPSRGRVLLVRNSWGENWGAGGFALLPVEYLIAHAVQAAAVRP